MILKWLQNQFLLQTIKWRAEIKAGFDGAFAMGLVLVLDQINGEDYVDDGTEPFVHPSAECP